MYSWVSGFSIRLGDKLHNKEQAEDNAGIPLPATGTCKADISVVYQWFEVHREQNCNSRETYPKYPKLFRPSALHEIYTKN
jgi:hypothetical protein